MSQEGSPGRHAPPPCPRACRPRPALALAAWDPRGAVFPTSHVPSGAGEKGEPTTAGPPRLAHLSSHAPGVTHPSIRPRPRPAPLLPPLSPGARGNFSPHPGLLCALQAPPCPSPPPSQVMLLAAPFQLHTHLSPQGPRLDSRSETRPRRSAPDGGREHGTKPQGRISPTQCLPGVPREHFRCPPSSATLVRTVGDTCAASALTPVTHQGFLLSQA